MDSLWFVPTLGLDITTKAAKSLCATRCPERVVVMAEGEDPGIPASTPESVHLLWPVQNVCPRERLPHICDRLEETVSIDGR